MCGSTLESDAQADNEEEDSRKDVDLRAAASDAASFASSLTGLPLLLHHEGSLFVTISDERMKKTLTRTGFVQRGHEWQGRTSRQLSLWLRLDSQRSRSPQSNVCKQQGAHK